MKIAKRKTAAQPKNYCNLMRFYNAWNAGQLIAAQQKHILRLMNKINAALHSLASRNEEVKELEADIRFAKEGGMVELQAQVAQMRDCLLKCERQNFYELRTEALSTPSNWLEIDRLKQRIASLSNYSHYHLHIKEQVEYLHKQLAALEGEKGC